MRSVTHSPLRLRRTSEAAEAWVDAHLDGHVTPRQRRDLAVILAAPYVIRKTARGKAWMATRWFWNLGGESKWLLLLGLKCPPRTAEEFDVVHKFLLRRTDLGTRKVLAYYDTDADRREGSFLDQFRIEEAA